MSTEPRKRRYPDHPTAPPQPTPVTMLDKMRWQQSLPTPQPDPDSLVRAAHYRNAIAAMRAVEVMREGLERIAGGPAQEALCASPTRRTEHIMGNCLHCKAREALAAARDV